MDTKPQTYYTTELLTAKKGFVLIPLLIVVGIVGFVATLSYSKKQINTSKNFDIIVPPTTDLLSTTNTATPEITESMVITSTPTIQVISTFDCAGPDGKHFKTSQIECENFNQAWSVKPTPIPTTKDVIKQNNNVECRDSIPEIGLKYDFGSIPINECIQKIKEYTNQQVQITPPSNINSTHYNEQALQLCLASPIQKLNDYNKKVAASGLTDYASNPYVLGLKQEISNCYSSYGQN